MRKSLVSITPIRAQLEPKPPDLQINDRRKYCMSWDSI